MPKIKLTKSALKQQRDSLKQFQRFLPTLQLKKQQLQLEMRKCQDAIASVQEEETSFSDKLNTWLALFGERESLEKICANLTIERINTDTHNIAGVDIPVFVSVDFHVQPYDLFTEDPFIDDAINAVKKMIELKTRKAILEEQYKRIGNELRTTTQRVNLFEKVKIPEAKENIRVIQIYLGDQDTAGVARAKIAKSKLQEEAPAA